MTVTMGGRGDSLKNTVSGTYFSDSHSCGCLFCVLFVFRSFRDPNSDFVVDTHICLITRLPCDMSGVGRVFGKLQGKRLGVHVPDLMLKLGLHRSHFSLLFDLLICSRVHLKVSLAF